VRAGGTQIGDTVEPERAEVWNAKGNPPVNVAESVTALIAVACGVWQLTTADAVEDDQNDAREDSQVRNCAT
jgi:hypothetical protein